MGALFTALRVEHAERRTPSLSGSSGGFEPLHPRPARMSAIGRLLPFTNATFWFGERPLVGESGHRNFDAKPRTYEFASGCSGFVSGHSRTSGTSSVVLPVTRAEGYCLARHGRLKAQERS